LEEHTSGVSTLVYQDKATLYWKLMIKGKNKDTKIDQGGETRVINLMNLAVHLNSGLYNCVFDNGNQMMNQCFQIHRSNLFMNKYSLMFSIQQCLFSFLMYHNGESSRDEPFTLLPFTFAFSFSTTVINSPFVTNNMHYYH
ncbi:hypothetical protein ACJX0J_015975, partial [Zea mays]